MYCDYCGRRVNAEDEFCRGCGAPAPALVYKANWDVEPTEPVVYPPVGTRLPTCSTTTPMSSICDHWLSAEWLSGRSSS